MIPVYQTKFGPTEGNCWAACVASILEVSINEIPNMDCQIIDDTKFHKAWQTILNEWLSEKYGLGYMEIIITYPWIKNLGYHIICGTSPRNKDIQHACVGYNGKMVHDPIGPDGEGVIEGTEQFGLFYKLFK